MCMLSFQDNHAHSWEIRRLLVAASWTYYFTNKMGLTAEQRRKYCVCECVGEIHRSSAFFLLPCVAVPVAHLLLSEEGCLGLWPPRSADGEWQVNHQALSYTRNLMLMLVWVLSTPKREKVLSVQPLLRSEASSAICWAWLVLQRKLTTAKLFQQSFVAWVLNVTEPYRIWTCVNNWFHSWLIVIIKLYKFRKI